MEYQEGRNLLPQRSKQHSEARRALRGLKGLVRLQAIFRGYRVRKKATLTLKCMHSLFKVQAHVRGHRCQTPEEKTTGQQFLLRRSQLHYFARESTEGWNASKWAVEDLQELEAEQKESGSTKREGSAANAFSKQIRNDAPRKRSERLYFDPKSEENEGIWLEHWIQAARTCTNAPLITDLKGNVDQDILQESSFPGSTKVVTEDSTRQRLLHWQSKSTEFLPFDAEATDCSPSHNFQLQIPSSSSETVHVANPIPSSHLTPIRFNINAAESLQQKKLKQETQFRDITVEFMSKHERDTTTAAAKHGDHKKLHSEKNRTAKCDDDQRRNTLQQHNHPNYMTTTQSSKAKVRSFSAPKQRPDGLEKEAMQLSSERKVAASTSQRFSLQGKANVAFKKI